MLAYFRVRNRYWTNSEFFPQQDKKSSKEKVPRHLRDQKKGYTARVAQENQVVSEIVLRRIDP